MISFFIGLLVFVVIAGLVAFVCAWAIAKVPVAGEIGPAIVWGLFAVFVLLYILQNIGKLGLHV